MLQKIICRSLSASAVIFPVTAPFLSLPLTMTTNFPWVPSTPSFGVEGNPSVDAKHQEHAPKNKSDRLAGLFGEGGYLWENIDTAKAVWPLTIWCFLTGYMSVTLFFCSFEEEDI